MSYVISSSQRLASMKNLIENRQPEYEVEGFETEHFNVGFGHPLYTYASDIVRYVCVAEEGGIIPVMPMCGVTIALMRHDEEHRSFVCGANCELRKIEVEQGDVVTLIIFTPCVANSLLNRPVGEVTGKTFKAAEVLNGSKQIDSCLRQSMEPVEKIKLISTILRTHILQRLGNGLAEYCVRRIFETNGSIKIEELAREVGVTSRYIGKIFENHVGLSAKYCAGIVKLKETVKKIQERPEERLTDIAAECGYFDHTHMNKSFRKMLYCSSGGIREGMFNNIDYTKVVSYIPKFE